MYDKWSTILFSALCSLSLWVGLSALGIFDLERQETTETIETIETTDTKETTETQETIETQETTGIEEKTLKI